MYMTVGDVTDNLYVLPSWRMSRVAPPLLHISLWRMGKTNSNFRALRSSGLLRSDGWWFLTDVSGQLVGPFFRGQESKKFVYRNVGEKLALLTV